MSKRRSSSPDDSAVLPPLRLKEQVVFSCRDSAKMKGHLKICVADIAFSDSTGNVCRKSTISMNVVAPKSISNPRFTDRTREIGWWLAVTNTNESEATAVAAAHLWVYVELKQLHGSYRDMIAACKQKDSSKQDQSSSLYIVSDNYKYMLRIFTLASCADDAFWNSARTHVDVRFEGGSAKVYSQSTIKQTPSTEIVCPPSQVLTPNSSSLETLLSTSSSLETPLSTSSVASCSASSSSSVSSATVQVESRNSDEDVNPSPRVPSMIVFNPDNFVSDEEIGLVPSLGSLPLYSPNKLPLQPNRVFSYNYIASNLECERCCKRQRV